jgi:NAD(P)-dependent dehydrogenase (short-subunit alcohol dehydrogenase family)
MSKAIVIGAHPTHNVGGRTAAVLRRDGWVVDTPGVDVLDVIKPSWVEDYNLRADALVYSAGFCSPEWIWQMPVDSLYDQVTVNLTGCLHVVSRYINLMFTESADPLGGYKRVVIVGSRAAETPHRGQVPYNAAKAGLRAAVATMAREVHQHGFRVFLIEPGAIDGTDYGPRVEAGARSMGLHDRAGATRGTFGHNLHPGEVAHMIAQILTGRYDRLAGAPIPFGGGPQ